MRLKDVKYRKNSSYWEAAIFNDEFCDMEEIVTIEDKCNTKKIAKKMVDEWIWMRNGCKIN